ncbi:MAG: hypothetical protein U1E86_25845 [Burkholderiaceae bacterium]
MIDGIAFQTNILALNAAVKPRAPASRARLRGRGQRGAQPPRSAARRRPRRSRR